MIYITGDCHSDFRRFMSDNFPEQEDMTKDDYVIICGDFGGIWYRENDRWYAQAEAQLDWLDSLPYTTLFIDGNHENFDRIYQYSVKDWNGGKVHEIRPTVLHLMRGEVFTLQDKTFWCFGGASSHDIRDGILEEDQTELIEKWERDYYKLFRVNHVSWWAEELPNEVEIENGQKHLEEYDHAVDFIITHSPCASTVALLGQGRYKQDRLTNYLEDVRSCTKYKKWFFGHMHDNKAINEKEILLYEQIIRVV